MFMGGLVGWGGGERDKNLSKKTGANFTSLLDPCEAQVWHFLLSLSSTYACLCHREIIGQNILEKTVFSFIVMQLGHVI